MEYPAQTIMHSSLCQKGAIIPMQPEGLHTQSIGYIKNGRLSGTMGALQFVMYEDDGIKGRVFERRSSIDQFDSVLGRW